MKRLEYTYVDKSEWPEGPWDDEPDKIQWQDEATGLPCLVVRNHVGALCGYVGVTEGHVLYDKDYDIADNCLAVHGGVTMADSCDERDEGRSICHKPEPGEPDNVWWIGFDCAHYGDLVPLLRLTRNDNYRDVAYVTEECRKLASQLKEMTAGDA